jgi:hypothetical protein
MIALLLACEGASPIAGIHPTTIEAPPPQLIAADALPPSAPGVVLLVRLSEERAEVHGTVLSEQWVDLDAADDDTHPFRYRVLDADGAALYSRSTPGPVLVQEYLGYYETLSGFDILSLYPELGDVAVTVPLLEGGQTVALQLRDDDGEYVTIGTYDLSGAADDDQGLSEALVGSETLHDAGDPASRLDVLLVGDGYTEAELSQWYADADAMADALLSAAPLSEYAGLINVHRVDAVSAESGVSFDCVEECRFRDTAFGSVFAVEFVNQLLGTDYRTTAIFQQAQWEVARAASAVPFDVVIVIANTSHSGGFALHYATVPLGDDGDWPLTGVHELAHVLGLLGDEYEKDDCVRSQRLPLPENITDQPEDPPWSKWIAAGTPLPTPDDAKHAEVTGAFMGAFNCDDLARPAQTCRMRSSSAEAFCPVCAEQLVRRVFAFADAVEDIEATAEADGWRFTVQAALPLQVTWTLDGTAWAVTDAETPLFIPAALSDGAHTLSAELTHTTERVRLEDDALTERREWVLTQ